MQDLISRQAAIDAIDGKFNITGRENAETILDYINGVDKKLRELPSAERRGRWIFKEDRRIVDGYDWQCSQCNSWQRYTSNYCPNCGAKMEGEGK